MTAASRSLATALWGARFASGLLPQSYTTNRDTTRRSGLQCRDYGIAVMRWTAPRTASAAKIERMQALLLSIATLAVQNQWRRHTRRARTNSRLTQCESYSETGVAF